MEKLGKTIKKAITITLSDGDAGRINDYFKGKDYVSFAGFTRMAIMEKIERESKGTDQNQFKAELD